MTGTHLEDSYDPEFEREVRWANELLTFADSRGWSADETAIACGTVMTWLFIQTLGINDLPGRMSSAKYCEFAKLWERARLSGLGSLNSDILPLELHLLIKAEQAAQSDGDPS